MPVSSSLWDSGLQLELACRPAYRMASLGLASLLVRQQFGKVVLDELHKRFGWIPLYDHMNHSVEDQKVWIEFEEEVYDSVGQLIQFARCVRVLRLSFGSFAKKGEFGSVACVAMWLVDRRER